MVKCKIITKNKNDTNERHLLLPHKKKDHDNFLKEIKVDLYLLTFNDYDYDEDDYVEREAKILRAHEKGNHNMPCREMQSTPCDA